MLDSEIIAKQESEIAALRAQAQPLPELPEGAEVDLVLYLTTGPADDDLDCAVGMRGMRSIYDLLSVLNNPELRSPPPPPYAGTQWRFMTREEIDKFKENKIVEGTFPLDLDEAAFASELN